MKDVADAEILRLQGNECYKERRFYKAIELYTQSLECCPSSTAFSNRSQCFLKINRREDALIDSRIAFQMDSSNSKAFYRHAQSLIALGLFEIALFYLKCIRNFEKNKDIAKLIASISGKKNKENIVAQCVAERISSVRHLLELNEIQVKLVPIDKDIEAQSNLNNEEQITSSSAARTKKHFINVPSSSYDVILAFEALKHNPEEFIQFFLLINMCDYKKLLDDMVTSDMVSTLLIGIHKTLNSLLPQQIFDLLIGLASVKRFDVMVMFLEAQDKQKLREIMDHFEREDERVMLVTTLYQL